MKYIQFRSKLDRAFLIGSGICLVAWLVGLQYGCILVPQKYRHSETHCLNVNPEKYWFDMNFWIGLGVVFLLLAIIEFPKLQAWHKRFVNRLKAAEKKKPKRSFLWLAIIYGVVPLAIMGSVVLLLAHFGVR